MNRYEKGQSNLHSTVYKSEYAHCDLKWFNMLGHVWSFPFNVYYVTQEWLNSIYEHMALTMRLFNLIFPPSKMFWDLFSRRWFHIYTLCALHASNDAWISSKYTRTHAWDKMKYLLAVDRSCQYCSLRFFAFHQYLKPPVYHIVYVSWTTQIVPAILFNVPTFSF